jgi:hypothetical protein
MWVFLAGLAAMTGFLGAIGVTRNRVLSVRRWTAAWAVASLSFAVLLVGAFLYAGPAAMEAVHGAAVGYAAAVGAHSLHHYLDEVRGIAPA